MYWHLLYVLVHIILHHVNRLVVPTVCILLCLLVLTPASCESTCSTNSMHIAIFARIDLRYLRVLVCIVWPVLHAVVCIDIAASIEWYHFIIHAKYQYLRDIYILVQWYTACHTMFNAIITGHTRIFSFNFDFQPTGWSEGKTMAQEFM